MPGDPDRIASVGRSLRKTADELERQIRNVKAVAEVDAWDSKAGREFREKARGNVKKLEAAFERYDIAAEALGSRVDEIGGDYAAKRDAKDTTYATDLNRAQEIADQARKDARQADDDKTGAKRSLDGLTGAARGKAEKAGGTDPGKKLRDKVDAADDAISAAREKIETAKSIRNRAAKKAREALSGVADHDSLKDSAWDTALAAITEWTSKIATVCGIASMLVGWIPVIGQALAGVLGAISMIATLVNTLATLVQVLRGNADWMDLGMAALGFALMGVGKGFSKIAGKYSGRVLAGRLGKAGFARTPKQLGRAAKNLNRSSGSQLGLGKSDMWKSLKEPFTDLAKGSTWGKNGFKPLFEKSNWREMSNTLAARGGGSAWRGVPGSLSIVDPGVANQLKNVKELTGAAAHVAPAAVNRISRTATGLSLFGSGVTLAGLGMDGNLNPLLG
ncbi:hypothetical protein [Streptomyces tsukubensis]|uniref:hypothetical protein n=1 Tax=Streptomyces tsukubensis TaxID=83656 RepID=UPI0011800C25|nr:hypothetical protein [Streptomyces tsukubensis]QFR95034.1 hypothetical protein GBW32_20895 [Streptomyces tsukubensis]